MEIVANLQNLVDDPSLLTPTRFSSSPPFTRDRHLAEECDLLVLMTGKSNRALLGGLFWTPWPTISPSE
jgi:hypothetical protein